MSQSPTGQTIALHDVEPRETIGRETIARFEGQFRAASYACLAILKNEGIDRVYCDYHDDYVQRERCAAGISYHFFQVKTNGKRNFQWGTLDLLGIYKRKPKKAIDQPSMLANSFVGRLLVHTIKFKETCGTVVFLTNVHFDDDIESLISDIEKSNFENKHIQEIIQNFNEALSIAPPLPEDEIKKAISKLSFVPGLSYINTDNPAFEAMAIHGIKEFSEIDLDHSEAKGIVESLVSLVRKKSLGKIISQITEHDLDEIAGIGIEDLLEILSISAGAYHILRDGGDIRAIRSASIIQRKLSSAGLSKDAIEYCSRCKIEWDIWWRDKRHFLLEFDLNFLQESLNKILKELINDEIDLHGVHKRINEMWKEIEATDFAKTLTKDLLVGGIFSALVRSEA